MVMTADSHIHSCLVYIHLATSGRKVITLFVTRAWIKVIVGSLALGPKTVNNERKHSAEGNEMVKQNENGSNH